MIDHTSLMATAKAATPGPWFNDNGVIWHCEVHPVCCGRVQYNGDCCGDPEPVQEQVQLGQSDGDNAAYIAAASPDVIIALLEEMERMRGGLEKLIEMNRQHAEDQYGRADVAELWACVVVARAALGETP